MIPVAPLLRADRRQAALRPVREALLARAREEADRCRAAAEAEGKQGLATAQVEVRALLAAARAQGEADAAMVVRAQRAQDQRAAREVVLRAQRSAYDELHRQMLRAVRAWWEGDAGVRARLAAWIRGRLGPDAIVQDAPDGGLLARSADGHRRIDASLTALVDSALAELDLESLWRG